MGDRLRAACMSSPFEPETLPVLRSARRLMVSGSLSGGAESGLEMAALRKCFAAQTVEQQVKGLQLLEQACIPYRTGALA